jgi:ATP-binding cassette, subfamily F, member 3
MSLLTATNLSQSLGFVDIFEGLSVSVTHDEKAGLIGPNGIGKTTLLQVMAGIEPPSRGTVHVARGKTIGYLPQEAVDAFGGTQNTVYAEMLTTFEHLHAIEARMRELETVMLTDMSVMDEYGDLQTKFEHGGGYDYEMRIKLTLDGLGFGPVNQPIKQIASWETPIAHLSGGQKTRALLARLLLQAPDLLILDEPTNHLDIDAIEWLEKTLVEWPGALLICSHDRLFLDKVVNRVWEMSRQGIEVYRGNYSAYLKQRDERFERRLSVFNAERDRLMNDARLIKRDFDRIKAGWTDEKPTWAIGKLRRLTTDVVTIEKYGVEYLLNNDWNTIAARMNGDGGVPTMFSVEDAVKRSERLRAPQRPPVLNLQLEPQRRSGEIVLRTKNLRVGYPGNPLFDCEDLELRWRERAALIGPNGSGKTTFLKTALAGRTLSDDQIDIGLHPEMMLQPLAGVVEAGSSLRIGYFAQAHDELDPEGTIQSELLRHAESGGRRMSEGELRYFLAQFLYTDDDLYKPVTGLSGGERARLALAILSLRGANFLVLDEPTNHLDIATQEVLESVLGSFDGSILLVSHDRYLVNKLAEQIWDIEDGRLRVFRGSYGDWHAHRRARPKLSAPELRSASAAVVTAPVTGPSTVVSSGPSKNASRKRMQETEQLEAEIAAHESQLAALEAQIAQSGVDAGKAIDLGKQHAALKRALDALVTRWAEQA